MTRVDVQLETIEALAGGLADPAQLLFGGREREAGRIADLARQDPWREPHDVGLPGGQAEGPPSPAADQERWVRALDGFGLAVVLGHRVVLAPERERAFGEGALQHGDRLLEPPDPRPH